ncbi:MAG: hypothetical protein QXG38_00065 [Candidatus Hadarchaeales archaeon]
MKVKEPPESGRTNLMLLRLLSKHFGCEVRLVGGLVRRRRLVELITRA